MPRIIKKLILLGVFSLSAALGCSVAYAQQNWPSRAVRLILPFGPASGADIAARILAEKLQPMWGQAIVIEGKPGGDGLISIGAVVSAKDDHILFFGPTSSYIVHPFIHENLPYDPDKDLTPIAGVAQVQIAMAVPTKLGIHSVLDFVNYAKRNPDKVSYGVAPGFSEFVFDGFRREQGLQIAKVPYRDITTSPADLGEGRIQLAMMSYAAMRSTEELGTIKIIAMNSHKRSEIALNIPSVVEAGFPGLVASPILGFVGSREISLASREKIARDIGIVLQDPKVRERLNASGQSAAAMNVQEFAAGIKEQKEQVERIAKVLNMPRKR